MSYQHNNLVNFRTLPAKAGLYWIYRGWTLLHAKPLSIMYAVSIMWGLDFLLSGLPFIGQLLAALITPSLHLGLMGIIAVRTIPVKESTMQQLFIVFKMPILLRKMLRLGAAYIMVVTTAILLLITLYQEQFKKINSILEAVEKTIVNNNINNINNISNISNTNVNVIVLDAKTIDILAPLVGDIMLMGLPLLLLITLVFWFTQQLAGWHGQSVRKSLFFSAMACWRNKLPFAVFISSWGIILLMVATILTEALKVNSKVIFLFIPMIVFFISWLMCSAYSTYESTIEFLE